MEYTERHITVRNYRKKSKTCTDSSWLFLFVVLWVSLIIASTFAIIYGHYLPIINGYDSFGNACGVKSNTHYQNFSLSGKDTYHKSYLLSFDSWSFRNELRICVEMCPDQCLYSTYDMQLYNEQKKVQLCRYDFDMEVLLDGNYAYDHELGPCPRVIFQMSYPLKHRCVPDLSSPYHKADTSGFINYDGGVAQIFFVYVYLAWPRIAALCGTAVAISLVLLVMMRWLFRITTLIVCSLVIAVNTGLCAQMWKIHNHMPDDPKVVLNLLQEFLVNKKVVWIATVLSSAITGALAVTYVFFARKLFKSVTLLNEAGKCINKLPRLVIIPFTTLILLVGSFGFWSYIMLCATTANYAQITPFKPGNPVDPHLRKIDTSLWAYEKVVYVEFTSIRSTLYLHIVGFIWTTEFIFACEEFCLSAMVAHWYFKKPTIAPTIHAIGILFKHHLGTAVKRCFLTTIFRILHLISTLLNRMYDLRLGSRGRCPQMLNPSIYAVVAMENIDFCSAGRTAFNTMATCPEELEDLNNVTDCMFFFAKLLVASCIYLVGVIQFKDQNELYFYMAPTIWSSVLAFYIAHVIISLFEVITDTLVLCACEDKQIYGRGGRWTEGELAKFFEKDPINMERGSIHVIKIRSFRRHPFRSAMQNQIQ